MIYDFAGPYTIGRDSFAFGIPTRYVQCRVAPEQASKWDDAVAKGCAVYETRMHNLWCVLLYGALRVGHLRWLGSP